jgi:hypothetical protein
MLRQSGGSKGVREMSKKRYTPEQKIGKLSEANAVITALSPLFIIRILE